jgi:hypothetical protein
MQVDLSAHTGMRFTEIHITEHGDYGILGEGSVSVEGTATVSDLLSARSLSDSLVVTPASPINSGSGTWSATTIITLDDPQAWTDLTLELENGLLAVAEPGSAAFIEKKVVGGELSIRIIPEPGALALIALGSTALIRRRRYRS